MTKKKMVNKKFCKAPYRPSTTAFKGTTEAIGSQQHLDLCKFTTSRAKGRTRERNVHALSPFLFPFQCLDHQRAMEQCEIGWDRIGKRPEAKVLLSHILRNYYIPITHHKLCAFQYLYFDKDHQPN